MEAATLYARPEPRIGAQSNHLLGVVTGSLGLDGGANGKVAWHDVGRVVECCDWSKDHGEPSKNSQRAKPFLSDMGAPPRFMLHSPTLFYKANVTTKLLL